MFECSKTLIRFVISVGSFPRQLAAYLKEGYSLLQLLFIMVKASIDEKGKKKVNVELLFVTRIVFSLKEGSDINKCLFLSNYYFTLNSIS